MNIPAQLKIGGHFFKVDASEELDGKAGETIYKKGLIRICSAQPQSQKEAALFHEIFHVLNSTLGDTNLGHALQDSLTEQLYEVLKGNDLLK